MHKILLSVTPEKVIERQREDAGLKKCFASVVSAEKAKTRDTAYTLEAGVLTRKWSSNTGDWSDVVLQVVVPKLFRHQVLLLAHDQAWSGHLRITKTYNRVLCPSSFLLARFEV